MHNSNVLINSDYGPIIININDSVIGKHIAKSGYWAKDDINLIKQLLNFLYQKKSELLVYDIGSNIGTHSLALAKTYQEKIKIRAFEAQRQIFNMLCGTVALNGLSNIYCYNSAVSDQGGVEIDISQPNYSVKNNFGVLELLPAKRSDMDLVFDGSEKVKTIELNTLNESVDFIKVDVEGMEDKVLMGSEKIISISKPICFVEIHKTDAEFVFEFFKRHNYCGFIKGHDLIAIPLEHQIQVDSLQRIF